MKKYILIKDYMVTHGVVVKEGSVVELSAKRANHALLIQAVKEFEPTKKKSNTKKKIENGSNSSTN